MKESWLQKHSVCVFVCVCPLGVCVTIVYRGGSRIDGRGVLVSAGNFGFQEF